MTTLSCIMVYLKMISLGLALILTGIIKLMARSKLGEGDSKSNV